MQRASPIVLVVLLAAAACSGNDSAGEGGGLTPSSGAARELVPRTVLTDWDAREMQPVDPQSLRPLPEYEAIESGRWATNTVSPNGRLMFSESGLNQTGRGLIHLYDLAEWRELFTLDEPVGSFYSVAWSRDSERVYFGIAEQLWVLDVRKKEAKQLAAFDYPAAARGFQPIRMDVSPDGSRLYLFAFNQADTNTSTPLGDPFLLAVDAESGDELARLALPDVLIGWRTQTVGGEERGMSYTPGLAMSPDGERYYVAHPDENRLTVVDLESLRIERVATPAREKSHFDRAIGLFVSEAEAKSSNGNAKTILASPDGRYLYVAESRTLDPPAEIASEGKLTVVRADRMTIVSEQDGPARITLTQDGRRLLAWGSSHRWLKTGEHEWSPADYVGYGVTVYDAATGEIEHRVDENGLYGWIIPGGDGRHAYVFDLLREEGGSLLPDCQVPCEVVHVLDLDTGEFTAEHRFENQAVSLLAAGYLAD